jgi:hypothetical protein
MPLFIERTHTDGLLDTRGYKLRCFAEQLATAAIAPAAVVVVALALGGGGSVFAFYASLGALLALVVAMSVKSVKGAAVGGFVCGVLMLALLLTIHYGFSHPILPD